MSSKLLYHLHEFAVLIRFQNLGTSLTAIIGALSVMGYHLNLLDFLMLFFMAAITNVGGQIHNDILDFDIDKNSAELKDRPLVKGVFSLRSAKIMVLTCLALNITIALFYFGGIYAFGVLLTSMLFGTLYNMYSKKLTGADVFLSLSFALFALYGAIVVTPNFDGFTDITVLTWIIVGMSLVHVQIMNSFQGGLKDIKNDAAMGAKTLAVRFGVRVSADDTIHIPASFCIFNMAFILSTVVLVCIPFFSQSIQLSFLQQICILLLIFWMLSTAIRLLRMKKFDKKKVKHLIRNHELARFALVPVLLFNFIGIGWTVFLVVEPIAWFTLANYILYKETWSNPKLY